MRRVKFTDPDAERATLQEALGGLRWNWKGTAWRIAFVLGLVVIAYVVHYLNYDNPALERKLVGCWGIAGKKYGFAGAEILEVLADGRFTESSREESPAFGPKFAISEGVWQLRKDEWTLFYNTSSGNFGGKGGRLVVKVLEATDNAIRVQDHYQTIGVYFRLPTPGGVCRPMI